MVKYFTVLCTWLAANVALAIPIATFGFGGQSNSCGPVGPAPPHLWVAQQHYFRTNCSGAFDDWSSKYVGTLRPTAMWGTAFGPEVSFGQAFTEKIAVLKFAKSGSSMSRWIDGDRELFEGMKDEYELGNADLIAQGYEPQPMAAYFWNHGEFDSGSQATADLYASRIEDFIEAIREEYGQQVRFIFTQLHKDIPLTYPNQQWVDDIRIAQEYIANTIPNVRMVNVDDLALSSDGLHASPEMQDVIGQRFAKAYLTPSDLNYDGVTDGKDFLDWQRLSGRSSELQEWKDGFNSPSIGAVPEPNGMVLLVIGLVGIKYLKL